MTDSLHIIGSRMSGGAEQFCMRLIRALNAEGHTAVPVFRPESPLCHQASAMPKPHQIGMRNGWDFISVMRIRDLIKHSKTPVVQTYMGRATRLTRIPRTRSAVHVARLGGYYKIQGYYRHAHAWVGNTRGICDYLVREGLPADRVFHIGNFVDLPARRPYPSRAELRHDLRIPESAPVILALGRFIPSKGFDDLIEAMALVRARVPEAYLILAGDGPHKPALHNRCFERGLSANIRFVGWQFQTSPYFNASDYFVCPSRHEPLGNVILEAWAHRLPVVSTRNQGAEELITDPDNGLLAPAESPKDLADRITDMIRAPEASKQQLIENGFQTLRRNHSRQAVTQSYLDLYARLTGAAA